MSFRLALLSFVLGISQMVGAMTLKRFGKKTPDINYSRLIAPPKLTVVELI
jgi:hypothetical protein